MAAGEGGACVACVHGVVVARARGRGDAPMSSGIVSGQPERTRFATKLVVASSSTPSISCSPSPKRSMPRQSLSGFSVSSTSSPSASPSPRLPGMPAASSTMTSSSPSRPTTVTRGPEKVSPAKA